MLRYPMGSTLRFTIHFLFLFVTQGHTAMTPTEFDNAIRSAGMTGLRLSRLINVRPATISYWRAGKAKVPGAVSELLALMVEHNNLVVAFNVMMGTKLVDRANESKEFNRTKKEPKQKTELKPFRFIAVSDKPPTKQLIQIPAPVDPRRAQPKSKYGSKTHAKHVEKAAPDELSYSACDDE